MKPIVEMTPYLIADCTGVSYEPTPFTWMRREGMYQTKKVGDSGPVAIKLMEMHAFGCTTNQMGGLTEECIHPSRKKYAVEVYDTFLMD